MVEKLISTEQKAWTPETAVAASASLERSRNVPLGLAGALFTFLGVGLYFAGIVLSMVRLALQLGEPFRTWNESAIWYSGVPTTLGLLLIALDLAFLLPAKRRRSRHGLLPPVLNRKVTVALTAYNDEESIAEAVADFRSHPLVRRVIVVDNNSKDRTYLAAAGAGAQVVVEHKPGYGQCVYRCLHEA
ncbi:MAG TPA: glycosyltransferase, partial [Bryobacteraceae bacterium]